MKVAELIARLAGMDPAADVMFDTEAQTYDVHLVPVAAAYPLGPAEGFDREIVYLSEDAPYRSDDRDARIAALEAECEQLRRLLPQYDCQQTGGALADFGGRHCPLGEPCYRCRAEAAEAALAAAQEENEVNRKNYLSVREAAMGVIDALALSGHPLELAWDTLCLLCGRYKEEFLFVSNKLAALRARADDAGRIERVADALEQAMANMGQTTGEITAKRWQSLLEKEARAVLAVADGREP